MVDTDIYRRSAQSLPGGSVPLLFVDVQALLRTFDAPPETAQAIAPIKAVSLFGSAEPEVVRATVVVIIDY